MEVFFYGSTNRGGVPVAVPGVLHAGQVRATDPDSSPLSVVPRDLHLTYARTELCHDCGDVPVLRSLYPVEFRYHLITGLLRCWACGYAFFKPKSALGYAESVARNLRSDASDAVRHHERHLPQ